MVTGNQSANGEDGQGKPLVFISYSHADEVWKNRLRPHLGVLEQDGHIEIWDDRQIKPSAEWYDEIKQVMNQAAVAVCLISSDYLNSQFCTKEEIPFLLERRMHNKMHLFLVLLRPCAWKSVSWLAPLQMLPGDGKSVAREFKDDWDTPFAEVVDRISDLLSGSTDVLPSPTALAALPADRINVDRLPVTGAELFGRQRELQKLDEVWECEQTNVVSLVAWGGVGKSTLVSKWLERLRADNYRGAERVFGWSFYSQGMGERAASADLFISEALRWFGDPEPEEGSPWAKGERLAELVRKQKTLLVLDGLEPLQDQYHGIKDPALQRLLEELARDNSGLCLITTREMVSELDDFGDRVVQCDLEAISPEAGRALLRVKGVRGTDVELEQASHDFGGHALAINLLASYLRGIEGHHVSHAASIPDPYRADERSGHSKRVMAALAGRFGNGAEVELLRILGLFDRPATGPAIAAVRAAPAIPGLTDHLATLSEAGWLRLLEKLRDTALLAPASLHARDEIDTHPMVREHFGEELRGHHPGAWCEAHGRLCQHFKGLPEQHQPDTLEAMAPLLQAIYHGCEAGRYEETLVHIYRKRILRNDYLGRVSHNEPFYLLKRLGAYGVDLSMIANYFEDPFKLPVSEIGERYQAFLFYQAGFDLAALGRLSEAVEPMRTGMEMALAQRQGTQSLQAAHNLSELHLILGQISEAVTRAEESIDFAQRIRDYWAQWANTTHLAYIGYQAGERDIALKMFGEAEAENPTWLVSLPAFRYFDVLLDLGRYEEVRDRAVYAIDTAKRQNWPPDIALIQLCMDRAEVLDWQRDDGNGAAEVGFRLDDASTACGAPAG
jgi:tetratricopeptide (TPR) repeat protein